MNETMSDELSRLRAENARLRALLAQHGIAADEPENTPRKPVLSLEEKVTLFRSLFQGREDVFARRWFSNSTGKSGYQPVCSREWNREFCDKKKFKCTECPNREFQPLGYNDITVTLKAKILTGEMSLAYMPFCRTIPVGFYVVTSMTRAVSMVIRRMLERMCLYVVTGIFRLISSVRGRATEHMCGFFLTGQ